MLADAYLGVCATYHWPGYHHLDATSNLTDIRFRLISAPLFNFINPYFIQIASRTRRNRVAPHYRLCGWDSRFRTMNTSTSNEAD